MAAHTSQRLIGRTQANFSREFGSFASLLLLRERKALQGLFTVIFVSIRVDNVDLVLVFLIFFFLLLLVVLLLRRLRLLLEIP